MLTIVNNTLYDEVHKYLTQHDMLIDVLSDYVETGDINKFEGDALIKQEKDYLIIEDSESDYWIIIRRTNG